MVTPIEASYTALISTTRLYEVYVSLLQGYPPGVYPRETVLDSTLLTTGSTRSKRRFRKSMQQPERHSAISLRNHGSQDIMNSRAILRMDIGFYRRIILLAPLKPLYGIHNDRSRCLGDTRDPDAPSRTIGACLGPLGPNKRPSVGSTPSWLTSHVDRTSCRDGP